MNLEVCMYACTHMTVCALHGCYLNKGNIIRASFMMPMTDKYAKYCMNLMIQVANCKYQTMVLRHPLYLLFLDQLNLIGNIYYT